MYNESKLLKHNIIAVLKQTSFVRVLILCLPAKLDVISCRMDKCRQIFCHSICPIMAMHYVKVSFGLFIQSCRYKTILFKFPKWKRGEAAR